MHLLSFDREAFLALEPGTSMAAATLTAGDIYLITYAGHGGQVPDLDDDEPSVDDEEPDGLDETWCLYDGQMIDDELSVLWGDFAHGVRILVVSDSCHSGTVIKAPREAVHPGPPARPATNAAAGGIRYRFMPPQVAAGTYRKNERFYEGILSGLRNLFGADPDRRAGRIGASVRLLSGCKDHQFAMDGNVNGLFTGRLLRVWDQGAFDGTYEEFHQQIVALMPSSQTPNHTTVGPDHPAFDAERPFTI